MNPAAGGAGDAAAAAVAAGGVFPDMGLGAVGGGAVGGGGGGLFGMNMNLGGAEVPFDEGGGAAEEMGFDVLEMNGGDWLGLPPGLNLNMNAAAGGGGGGGIGGVAWVGGGGGGGGGMDDSDGDEDAQAMEDAADAGDEVGGCVFGRARGGGQLCVEGGRGFVHASGERRVATYLQGRQGLKGGEGSCWVGGGGVGCGGFVAGNFLAMVCSADRAISLFGFQE